jgi:hypothetical protein
MQFIETLRYNIIFHVTPRQRFPRTDLSFTHTLISRKKISFPNSLKRNSPLLPDSFCGFMHRLGHHYTKFHSTVCVFHLLQESAGPTKVIFPSFYHFIVPIGMKNYSGHSTPGNLTSDARAQIHKTLITQKLKKLL